MEPPTSVSRLQSNDASSKVAGNIVLVKIYVEIIFCPKSMSY
jgi:hypothetical protein